MCLLQSNVFNFHKAHFISFFPLWAMLLVSHLQTLCPMRGPTDFLLGIPVAAVRCYFTFRAMVYFELIFIEGVRLRLRLSCWHVNVQLFQHHVERTIILPFSTDLPLHFCQAPVQYAEGGLLLNALLRPPGWHARPVTSTAPSCLLRFYSKSWHRVLSPLTTRRLQDYLSSSSFFAFPVQNLQSVCKYL